MIVFVTGGTGFIGSHLVDRLLKNSNDEIRCLVRSKPKWLEGKDIVTVDGALGDLHALSRGIEGADVVYHVAGVVKAPDQAQFDHANVEATEHVLRLAMKHRVPKLVVLSSLAACGPSFSRPLTEQDPLMPITMYGRSKKKMEEMVHSVADDSISVTLIRPPAVYGPREDQIFEIFRMASWGVFPIIGDGKSTRVSLVHVHDLVSGLVLAAAEQKPGVETYFLSSEETYTWEEVARLTGKVSGKKLYHLKVSPRFVKSVGRWLERSAALFGVYPVVNSEKAEELSMQWTCSVDKAIKHLGYRQKTGLYDGLSGTMKWYRRHHWL